MKKGKYIETENEDVILEVFRRIMRSQGTDEWKAEQIQILLRLCTLEMEV